MPALEQTGDGQEGGCDHCHGPIAGGALEGEDGEYCCPTCRYDAEVLDVSPDELTPRSQEAEEAD